MPGLGGCAAGVEPLVVQLAAASRTLPAAVPPVQVKVAWPKAAVRANVLHKTTNSLRIPSLYFISNKVLIPLAVTGARRGICGGFGVGVFILSALVLGFYGCGLKFS